MEAAGGTGLVVGYLVIGCWEPGREDQNPLANYLSAQVAPMPMASESTTAALRPRFLRSMRKA